MRRYLDRKLLRDLRKNLGALIAIAVVVACGVSAFVSMRSMVRVLSDAQRDYYELARFPQVFAQVRRAPDSELQALRALPGVARLEARVANEVVLRIPGQREPATARIVGTRSPSNGTLNHLVLREGRLPYPGEADAVVMSEGFARATDLGPGAVLRAVVGSRWHELRVVGIAVTAEYTYELRPGDMLPDPARYGILWMDAERTAAAFGMEHAWNEVQLTLMAGASERAVIDALDRRLAEFGSLGAYSRDLHPAHRFVSEEIRQNRTFAAVMPLIFLGVAAFLVHTVLGRVVSQQRDQIGTLKAFGVPSSELLRHYMLFALAPVLAGTLAGSGLGLWLAGGLARLYAEFYRFPELHGRLVPGVLAFAAALGIVSALLGALGALRRILAMPPAESMRPEPPASYARGIIDRVAGPRLRSPVVLMVLRGLTHRPWRTALGAFGIGLGAAVVITGTFGFDSVERMRFVLFERALRSDVSVTFAEAQGSAALHALSALPGVGRVEPVRSVAVRMRHGHRSRQGALVGVEPDARLRQVVDLDARTVRIAPAGVTLSASVARVLGLGVGDVVDIEFLDGRRRRISMPVGALVDDMAGGSAYVDAAMLPALVGVGDIVSGAELAVAPEALDALYERLAASPNVRSVAVRSALRRSFDETLSQNFAIVLTMLVIFAGALAAATVYNAGRVALSERSRDLASLRVLGFSRGEVARILFGELSVLAVMGIPVGIGIGIAFAAAIVASFGNNELFRMPLVVGPLTVAAGIAVPVIAGALAYVPLRRRLDELDLIGVLKTRE